MAQTAGTGREEGGCRDLWTQSAQCQQGHLPLGLSHVTLAPVLTCLPPFLTFTPHRFSVPWGPPLNDRVAQFSLHRQHVCLSAG